MSKENMDAVKSGDYGNKWAIKSEVFRPGVPSNYREGYYVGVNQITMPNKKPFNVYSFQEVEPDGKFGEKFSIASDHDIDDKMSNVQLKSFVGLEYTGRKQGKDASKQPFHTWWVGIDTKQVTYEAAQAKNVSLGGSASPVSAPVQAIGANAVDEDSIPF